MWVVTAECCSVVAALNDHNPWCCVIDRGQRKKSSNPPGCLERLHRQVQAPYTDRHPFCFHFQANLDENQMSSPTFLRALMTAVCKAAIIGEWYLLVVVPSI